MTQHVRSHQPSGTSSGAAAEAGFSLPMVLVASLIVLLGGLMLANRSGDGLISVAFQRDSNNARDAAETGFTRILGELNREHNRGLLVKDGSTADGNAFLWGQTEADNVRNACTTTANNLATNPNIGFSSGGTYGTVFLDATGAVVDTEAEATKAYRLLWVRRQPRLTDAGTPVLRIFQADGRGSVQMAVEGMALRNGAVISRTRLEKDLQLAPKCCNYPFGGEHGNVDYGIDPDSGWSVCIPSSWGIVAGAAQTNSGYLKINGVTTIETDQGSPVTSLTCIADSPEQCTFDPTSTSYELEIAPPVLGMPPANPTNPEEGPGTINGATLADTFLSCADVPPVDTLSKCKSTIQLNTGVPDAELPKFCKATGGTNGERGEVHCNLKTLIYSTFNLKIDTSSRKLRLYFPEAGQVVWATGNTKLEHAPINGGDSTDFSLFGCRESDAGCGIQELRLNGTPAGLELFAWFPLGTVAVGGNAAYSGVLWANRITSNGGVAWEIPGSGLAGALKLAGFGLEGDLNPPVFDWVARATQRFRWFGQ